MAGKGRGIHQARRRQLAGRCRIVGAGHCRAALRRFSADDQGRGARGGHWVVVAGQVARDAAGNLVGKGDMRAQIEQVGRNVDACLDAGGATAKDVVFMVSYVTQPAEFDKYADLRERYFGPPSPKSATVPVRQLASPDFLVQVEAFAAIR
jgi:2-iminobutanoate/2-iminopropanoate deaminase